MESPLVAPMLAMMLLTLVVWVFMYARRIRFITSQKLSPERLAIPGELQRLSPPSVSNPSDNLKNLFEMPVLFYAVVLLLIVTGEGDGADVVAAWIFVGFRVLHSLVHCTLNIVLLRFYLYLASSVAVCFLVGRTAYWLLSA